MLGSGRLPEGGGTTGSKTIATLTLGTVVALLAAGSALATHARPGSGTPFRVPLVTAFKSCGAPDSTHVSPLSLPSCSNVQTASAITTLGSNGAGGGFAKLTVVCTDAQTPPCNPSDGQDTEDVTFVVSLHDVVCLQGGVSGCSAPGADYTDEFSFVTPRLRITDHAGSSATCSNAGGSPPCVPVTTVDNSYSDRGQCVDNGGPNGAVCNVATSWDAGVPGAVREGQGAVVALGSMDNSASGFSTGLGVGDAGPDGNLGSPCPPFCVSTNDRPIALEGVFTP